MSRRLRPYRLCLARLPSWRQVFFLFIGAAFFLQSYATQTHIHPLPQPRSISHGLASLDSDATVKVDKSDQQAPSRDRHPANDDPAKCPLCQAVAHSGQYVWFQSAALILPHLSAAIVPVILTALRIAEPQSHDWQGRAPPGL